MNLKKRTMDEMITHFNDVVSEMNIPRKDKMTLLGMITAIGYEAQNAVDVAPARHGRWEKVTSLMHQFGYYLGASCSICGKTHYFLSGEMISNYCPNCGAVMDKDGDGNA